MTTAGNGGLPAPPALIGWRCVWGFASLTPDGRLQVSVHLDATEPWLVGPDNTVPMRVTVQDTDVFTG